MKRSMMSFILGLLTLFAICHTIRADELPPLTQIHAHNDYEHTRPLFDALSHGICSVEADIFLVNGKLLVAHDIKNVKPVRTLESLYLEPLQQRALKNRGHVYSEPSDFTLLIELKSDGAAAYAALEPVLMKYRKILTEYTPTGAVQRAVKVVITGNVPRAIMTAETSRLAAFDGTLRDIDSAVSADLMPWISDDWLAKLTF